GRKSIDDSQNTSPLLGFSYDDFNRIGCCAINGADFLTHLDSIEHINGISFPQDGEKCVSRTHSLDILGRRLNQLSIVSLAPDQARPRGFIERDSKFNARYCTHKDFEEVLNGLYEVGLA